ncbi:MAG: peptidylprolyl isomerase [Oscillospiraceae bacterium]|jgi:hypothetical protein
MSASREKKKRKEEAELGISKEQLRKKEELKAKKRRNRSIAVISAILVVFIAALCVYNDAIPFFTGRLLKEATAVEVGSEKFSAADFNYYFNSFAAQYKQNYGEYLSYLGVNTDDFLNQPYDSTQTWGDLIRGFAIEQIEEIGILAAEAEKEGYKLSDEEAAKIDEYFAQLDSYASNMGMDVDDYYEKQFGNGVTQEVYRRNVIRSTLADSFRKYKQDSFTYTDDQLEAYYNENRKTVDVADYRYFFVSGIAGKDEDEDKAMEDALNDAKEFVDRLGKGEKFSDLCVEYAMDISRERYEEDENESLKREATYESTLEAFRDWVFDDARRPGDVTYVEGDPSQSYTGYFVVEFISRERAEYNTVDYRSILSAVTVDDEDAYNENNADNPDAQPYDEYVDAAWVKAQSDIESLVAKWQSNGGDEEEFAKLAATDSDDSDAYASGGLVEQATKSQADPAIEDWLFNPARKPGDYEVFETERGMRLVYFVGFNLPRWKAQVTNTLRANDYDSWFESVSANYKLKEKKFGMHYAMKPSESSSI